MATTGFSGLDPAYDPFTAGLQQTVETWTDINGIRHIGSRPADETHVAELTRRAEQEHQIRTLPNPAYRQVPAREFTRWIQSPTESRGDSWIDTSSKPEAKKESKPSTLPFG